MKFSFCFIQLRYVEPVISNRVDNQTYYDPYTTMEPDPAVMIPPQQPHYPPVRQQPSSYNVEQRPVQHHSYRGQEPPNRQYHPNERVYTDQHSAPYSSYLVSKH